MRSIPAVCLFVPSLAVGGAERVALNLSQTLAKKGFKVDLVLQNAVGSFLQQVAPEVRVIDLKATSLMGKLYGLVRYLQREQPVVLLSILDNINLASWAQRLARVPTRVVVSLHINLSEQAQGLKTRLRPYVVRYSYPLADSIVAVSHGVARDLSCVSGLSLAKIQVLPNPIVCARVIEATDKAVPHPWFAPGQPPVILGVGRLAKEKDFTTLIRAFAQVRQHHPARLMILGEGEQRSRLELLIRRLNLEAEVALPGYIENPYPYMAKASVFVLSSTSEAFGNVLVEAMAVGTSIVSTDCAGGPREILEGGQYGKLVPIGDVEQMAASIVTQLKHPTDSDLLRQRAKLFSIEPVVNQYLEVLGISA